MKLWHYHSRRWRATTVNLVLWACALIAPPAIGSDMSYQLRGVAPEKRSEGVIPQKTAGGLILLSFTMLSTAPLPPDGFRVYIRFWSPIASKAYLSAQEINREKSYRLDADQSQWPAGDNEFSWPTSDVIDKLEVDVANLGVVVSERRNGGSGLVFPAIIALSEQSSPSNSYQVTVRPKYTCAPLTWTLHHVVDDTETLAQKSTIEHMASERARSIEFDLLDAQEGWYRLRFKCDREGHGSGSGVGSVQRRTYVFYHRRQRT